MLAATEESVMDVDVVSVTVARAAAFDARIVDRTFEETGLSDVLDSSVSTSSHFRTIVQVLGTEFTPTAGITSEDGHTNVPVDETL